MGSFFGSLLGAGANLFGGILGQQTSEANTEANIAAQRANLSGAYLPALVKNAGRAGLNPLAVLGQTQAGHPVAVGDNSLGQGIAAMGQDIGRAFQAAMPQTTKLDTLNEQLVQAKIDQTNADTTTAMLRNSELARKFAAPGSPPTVSHPLFQTFDDGRGGHWTGFSRDASESFMNAASWPTMIGLAPALIGRNVENAWRDFVRPDVDRAINVFHGMHWPDVGPAATTPVMGE